MPTPLRELGYEVSGPAIDADPDAVEPEEERTSGTLEELGYTTVESARDPEVVKSVVRARQQRLGAPMMSAPTGAPPSEYVDERNVRVLKDRYGERFDRDATYDNLPVLYDLGFSDRFSERRRKFKSYYPRGDLKREKIGSSFVELIREAPDEPYRVYESTVLSDIFSGETAGALAGIAASPLTGGGSLAMAGMTGLGTFGGSMTEFGVEELRGFQDTPLNEGLANAAVVAGLSSAIDLATMGAGRLTGISRVPFRTKGARSQLRAERVAEEKKFLPPMRGQITEFPLIPQIFNQAAATTRRIGRKVDEQEKVLLSRMREMTDTDFSSVSDKQLGNMLEVQRKEVERRFRGMAAATSTPQRFGETVHEAIERYRTISRKARDRLYGRAKKEGVDLEFDVVEPQDIANRYLSGHKMKTAGGEERRIGPSLSPKLTELLERVRESDSTIRTFTDADGVTQHSIDQLKDLRTNFYDFMVDGEGADKRVATEMWSSLRRSMENPARGSKRGRDLLMRANQANATREANLEVAAIRRAIANEEPGKLMTYFRSGNENAVRTIKNLSGKRWTAIKNEFLGNLTADPKTGISVLNSFQKDKGTLRLVMSETEETAMREYLRVARKMNEGKLASLQEGQLNRAHRMRELTKEGREKLEETIRLAGGPKSKFALDGRLGLMRSAVDAATTVSKDGEQILSADALIPQINKILKSDDYAPLISQQYREEMEDLLSYISKTRRPPMDFGSSLTIASKAEQTKNIANPIQVLGAWAGAGMNVLTGTLLMRPRLFKRVLQSEGLIDERVLRGMTQVASEMNETAERIEDETETPSATEVIYQNTLGKFFSGS